MEDADDVGPIAGAGTEAFARGRPREAAEPEARFPRDDVRD